MPKQKQREPLPGEKNPEGQTTIALGAERRKKVDEFRMTYAAEHGFSSMNLEDAMRFLIDQGLGVWKSGKGR